VKLTWDAAGLLPAIAQDRLTGEVRMLAWMNAAALEATISSGFATFFSRSRSELWQKGSTSGNRLKVQGIVADCDRDALLLLVDPEGPTCHTGAESCFFDALDRGGSARGPELLELERVVAARASTGTAEASYTRSLLEGGSARIGAKLREEAAELHQALEAESDERVASEAADLLFHLLVGLRSRGVTLSKVLETLAGRAGVSGHAEKASRAKV
jgi:phosphoribosyl-ATP pyrophosphohydrolase/phosphoribosyl-AMP cyclohydrolase